MNHPVFLFLYDTKFTLIESVKAFTPGFLDAVQEHNTGIYFIKKDKENRYADELNRNDLRWNGCVIWRDGKVVEYFKSNWATPATEPVAKAFLWMASGTSTRAANLVPSINSVTGLPKAPDHRYGVIPCYVLGRWDQVVELSRKTPVVLAAGNGMDIQRAENSFLRRVGSVFADRGYTLAVAPDEKVSMEGSVTSGLLAEGEKADGCYIVQDGEIKRGIARSSPAIGEDGWLSEAVTYLSEDMTSQ
jgi:hypothetical protein